MDEGTFEEEAIFEDVAEDKIILSRRDLLNEEVSFIIKARVKILELPKAQILWMLDLERKMILKLHQALTRVLLMKNHQTSVSLRMSFLNLLLIFLRDSVS